MTHWPRAPLWLNPKFWVPRAESEWAQSYACVLCYLPLKSWLEIQKPARKCVIMPGKQSLQFGLQRRENATFFPLLPLLCEKLVKLLRGKGEWCRLVLPHGWLVTRRCIEEMLNEPTKLPPFDGKLMAFTGSTKPPNKFPFQPPVSATSNVSISRLHRKPEGDNVLESKRPQALTNACDRAEMFDVRRCVTN